MSFRNEVKIFPNIFITQKKTTYLSCENFQDILNNNETKSLSEEDEIFDTNYVNTRLAVNFSKSMSDLQTSEKFSLRPKTLALFDGEHFTLNDDNFVSNWSLKFAKKNRSVRYF